LPTTGKIVADLKFAFWENIFTGGQDNRNVHFRTCFPGAPTNQLISQCRETDYNNLHSIRRLRNQIIRHEPIFTRSVVDGDRRIHDIIAWRNPVAAAWMNKKQSVLTLLLKRP
jgi:hypothetical protein